MLLLTSYSYAKDFDYKVSAKNIHYQLINSQKELFYKDKNFKKIFIKKKCNKTLVKTFLSQLFKTLDSNFPKAKTSKNAVAVQNKDKSATYYYRSSDGGKFLLKVPSKILNMSIRDKFRCQK